MGFDLSQKNERSQHRNDFRTQISLTHVNPCNETSVEVTSSFTKRKGV